MYTLQSLYVITIYVCIHSDSSLYLYFQHGDLTNNIYKFDVVCGPRRLKSFLLMTTLTRHHLERFNAMGLFTMSSSRFADVCKMGISRDVTGNQF